MRWNKKMFRFCWNVHRESEMLSSKGRELNHCHAGKEKALPCITATLASVCSGRWRLAPQMTLGAGHLIWEKVVWIILNPRWTSCVNVDALCFLLVSEEDNTVSLRRKILLVLFESSPCPSSRLRSVINIAFLYSLCYWTVCQLNSEALAWVYFVF